MKKLLGIVVISLLLSFNAISEEINLLCSPTTVEREPVSLLIDTKKHQVFWQGGPGNSYNLNNGIFGWHGSGFEFPNGRGRSPLNWSIRIGLKKIFHNCFKYSVGVDDGKIFDTKEIEIKNNEYIEEVISKAIQHIKDSAIKLLEDVSKNNLVLREQCDHAFLSFPKLSENSISKSRPSCPKIIQPLKICFMAATYSFESKIGPE